MQEEQDCTPAPFIFATVIVNSDLFQISDLEMRHLIAVIYMKYLIYFCVNESKTLAL